MRHRQIQSHPSFRESPAMPTGKQFLTLAAKHIGERYIFGALAPKDNKNWTGPWDCAEFVSWVAYQVTGKLYGCYNNGKPASADAYTGYWKRDADSTLRKIGLEEAFRTPGAILLRNPAPGLIGHIAFSDGAGGTLEAHSSKRGVIASTARDRRWDTGLLLPGVTYAANAAIAAPPAAPAVAILRLTEPHMKGAAVKRLQQALKAAGYNPGPIDSDFGAQTAAAVAAYQLAKGLVPDGEARPKTLTALGL